MTRRAAVLVTDHAVIRYLERAFPHDGDEHSPLFHQQQAAAADVPALKRLLAEQVHRARELRDYGRSPVIVAPRMGSDGHLRKYFYLRFVTPQRIRVYLAVDEKLRKVYTVLTLDQFRNTAEHRA